MSFVDLLFLKNSENVAQIFEYTGINYIFSRSERFQFKSLLLGGGGGPWDNILSNVGWRPNTVHVMFWGR